MSHLWNEKPDGDQEVLIAALKREIDWMLLTSTLRRTPEERLVELMGMQLLFDEGKRARAKLLAVSRAARESPGAG